MKSSDFTKLTEREISAGFIHDAKIFRLEEVRVILPDGNEAVRSVIRHNGAACILPVTGENIVLVAQYRVPAGRIMLELPAGKLDSVSEDPYDGAVRELEEETGFRAEKMEFLRKYIPAAGYSDEVIHIFVATGLYKTNTHPDEDEFVETILIPVEEAYEMCLDGRIEDSKTIIAVMTYYDRYVRNK